MKFDLTQEAIAFLKEQAPQGLVRFYVSRKS